jgi:hypothetical protein
MNEVVFAGWLQPDARPRISRKPLNPPAAASTASLQNLK